MSQPRISVIIPARNEADKIQTMVYYPLFLHLQEVYKSLGYKMGDFPESEWAQGKVLSLPMFAELSKDQIEQVAREIKKFLNRIS